MHRPSPESYKIKNEVEIIEDQEGLLHEYITLSIPDVGYADLSYDLDDPEVLTLVDITIEDEKKRGGKLGSLLFDEALKLAKEKGFTYLGINVANERIACLLTHRFNEEDVIIGPVTPEVAAQYAKPGEEYLSLRALERYLQDVRQAQLPGNESGMLKTRVMVQVKLNPDNHA